MVERNDPCWCGSGLKYKKCHLESDSKKNNRNSKQQNKINSDSSMIKTPEEIAGMRKAGAFNGVLMDYIRPYIKAGITTEEINRLVHEYTIRHGHIPACLGYHNFPKSVCVSINDVVCHGIPSRQQILKDGDIVNVDITTIVDGFHGDSSETFCIGNVLDETRKLVRVTAEALLRGIDAVKPEKPLSCIAEAIEPFVNMWKYSVVRQYTGHGIGRKFHEFFSVFHHISSECEKVILLPGMTLTIEPMINMGEYRVVTDRYDGWTVRTKDGSLSAQYEHTILVTETGAEVLTLTPSQRNKGIILAIPE